MERECTDARVIFAIPSRIRELGSRASERACACAPASVGAN
jgi:hypothetical protein